MKNFRDNFSRNYSNHYSFAIGSKNNGCNRPKTGGILVYIQPASIGSENMDEQDNSNLNGKLLKCGKCLRIWPYGGKNPYYATCTFCKSSVNVRKNKVVQLDSVVAALNQAGTMEEKVRI
jgi:hypothetical protein